MTSNREQELESEVMRLRQEVAWFHSLMRNDTIQPRDKVVLYETKFELCHSEADENGMAQIRVWKVAEMTGISTDMVGKSIKFLSEEGILDRKVGYVTNDRGGTEKAIFVGLTDLARTPSRIQMTDNKHGGKRMPKCCTACGHTEHLEHKKCICTACGTVFEETWKTIEDKGEEDDA